MCKLPSTLERVLGPILLGIISYLLCVFVPTRSIAHALGLFTPASGTALFGGVTMVLWIVLSELLYGYGASIITSLILIGLLLLTSPWYGIVDPYWFSFVGLLSVVAMGVIICLGVRLNNTLVASIVALASMHLITWISMILVDIIDVNALYTTIPLLTLIACISGLLGGVLAEAIFDFIGAEEQEHQYR